jgi:hypothetical protein
MRVHTVRNAGVWIALLVLGSFMSAGGASSALARIPSGPTAAIPSGSSEQGMTVQAKVADPSLANFDCGKVRELGIDRMMNLRASAIMVHCGFSPGGGAGSMGGNSRIGTSSAGPGAYGGTDADVILPDGTSPHLTQSESFVWANGATIVVNYNDSRTAPSCYSGISYSTDSGSTWHPSQTLCTSTHGTNEGDPIVVYNARLATWFAGDLAVGGNCGAGSTGGIGLWTSPDGIT